MLYTILSFQPKLKKKKGTFMFVEKKVKVIWAAEAD